MTDWICGLLDYWMNTKIIRLPIHQSINPAIHYPIPPWLARQEGIEPPTNGFGDRYSAN
jgi:hypothetical protein